MESAEAGWASKYQVMKGLAQQADKWEYYHNVDKAWLKFLTEKVAQSALCFIAIFQQLRGRTPSGVEDTTHLCEQMEQTWKYNKLPFYRW